MEMSSYCLCLHFLNKVLRFIKGGSLNYSVNLTSPNYWNI